MDLDKLQLSADDREILADFFTSTAYKSLRKVLEGWRLDLAISGMRSAANMEQLNHFRGQDYSIVQLHKMLKKNHSEVLKLEDEAKKTK